MKKAHPSISTLFSSLLILFTVAANAGDAPRAYYYEDKQPQQTTQYGPEYYRSINTFIKETSKRLDAIEKDLEEWGHGSFSGLELIPLPTGKEHESLAPGGNRTYPVILTDVNDSSQGGASLLDSRSLTTGLGLGVKIDPLGAPSQLLSQSQSTIARDRMEDAHKEEAEIAELLHQQRVEVEKQKLANLQEGTEPPLPTSTPTGAGNPLFSTPVGTLPGGASQPSTASPSTITAPAPDLARLVNNPVVVNSNGNSIGFTAPQGITAAAAATLNTRSVSPAEASAQAKSIAIQERITDLIAHPVAIDGNRALYMGIAQVSVSPGSRTREGYACEVTVRAELMANPKDASGTTQVSVFGMFPQARSQTLDLAYSKRSQFQLLMNLAMQYAAVGQEANGKAVLDYVKRLEKDVDTRSSLPVLVPNSDGTQVTYRFDPSLQALGDPAANKSKPANILHATSVPVLLALACDKEEVTPTSLMRLRMTTRWVPLEKRHWAKKYMVDWWHKAYANQDARYSDERILNNAKQLDEIVSLMYEHAGNLGKSGDIQNQNLRDAVVTRYRILEPRVSGNLITRSMPMPWKEKEKPPVIQAPLIVNLSPTAISQANISPQFAIRLQHFGEAPAATAFKVYLGGQEAQSTAYSGGKDGILTAAFQQIPQLPSGDVDLLVIRPDTSLSAAIRVQVQPLKPALVPEPPLAVGDFTPSVGHLYATTSLLVTGTSFAKADGTAAIKAVSVGGRDCTFEVISSTLVKVKVPAWRTKPTALPSPPDEIASALTFTDGKKVVTTTNLVKFQSSDIIDK